jgi:hypothetical protein
MKIETGETQSAGAWERRMGRGGETETFVRKSREAPISRGSVSDLVDFSLAFALAGARRHMLGAQASLPAMSALARNIEDAPPLKMTQLTQPGL